jgi:hypothetical protein
METHVELVSAVPGTECPDCGRATLRDALLVNAHGLVLLVGKSCATCAHRRHRAGSSRNGVTAAVPVPVPRLSA